MVTDTAAGEEGPRPHGHAHAHRIALMVHVPAGHQRSRPISSGSAHRSRSRAGGTVHVSPMRASHATLAPCVHHPSALQYEHLPDLPARNA